MVSVNVGFDDCGGVGVEPNERNLGRIVWGSIYALRLALHSWND